MHGDAWIEAPEAYCPHFHLVNALLPCERSVPSHTLTQAPNKVSIPRAKTVKRIEVQMVERTVNGESQLDRKRKKERKRGEQ